MKIHFKDTWDHKKRKDYFFNVARSKKDENSRT